MTDSVMTYVPTHLRHVPFNLAFTLDANDELMCVKLRDDKTFSRTLSDYEPVDIMGDWSAQDEIVLVQIYETLMGIA